jgi:hypothetical protein
LYLYCVPWTLRRCLIYVSGVARPLTGLFGSKIEVGRYAFWLDRDWAHQDFAFTVSPGSAPVEKSESHDPARPAVPVLFRVSYYVRTLATAVQIRGCLVTRVVSLWFSRRRSFLFFLSWNPRSLAPAKVSHFVYFLISVQ